MAKTTAKMALATWDQPGDVYDYVQLANNWNIVDLHDHSPGRGVQIGRGGIAAGAVGLSQLGSEVAFMPTGFIALWPFQGSSFAGSIPAGFLACDGSSYAQSSYTALYGVIGTTFGPTPPVTGLFAVPNLGLGVGTGAEATNLVWVIKT